MPEANNNDNISSTRKIRVYLDNCAYNRPYDDQSQPKIELETQAKIKIQRLIRNQEIELSSSYMSLYECGENPDISRANLITDFINKYSSAFVGLGNKAIIEQMARDIMNTGIKFKDACHIASAIYSHSHYLVSTDVRMLKYKTDKIKLINPVEYFVNNES